MPDRQPKPPRRILSMPTTAPVAVAVDSVVLLKGGRELHIRHGEQLYRLCHTRNDKLILIK